jgi:serine protease Do
MYESPELREPMHKRALGPLGAGRLLAVAGLIAVVSFGAGAVIFSHQRTGAAQTAQTTASTSTIPAGAAFLQTASVPSTPQLLEQGQPFSFADLAEQVSPAVVAILVDEEQQVQQPDVPDQFREFFNQFGQGQGLDDQNDQNGQPRTYRVQAQGSGFIIDPDGYVVTANHVIDNATKISVKLTDGRELSAKVVGADAGTDVALLKIDGVKDLPTVGFGDSMRLRAGDWVVAVGNPFGLSTTVTAGIVSFKGRDGSQVGGGQYTDYIQIDAPINSGNSGGPTFDLSGKVVGMNTAIISPSGGSVGIGFAIPASVIQTTVSQLKSQGSVTRGWLGVEIQSLTPDIASGLGIADAKGAIVAGVTPNSPAQKAGFVRGDVILRLNGAAIDDSRDLTRKVAMLQVGQKAQFTVWRSGKSMSLTANIAKRDEQALASANTQNGNAPRRSPLGQQPTSSTLLGLGLTSLDSRLRQEYAIADSINGVVITSVDPNSDGAEKGLSVGDVILSLNMKEVRSPRDVQDSISSAKDAKRDTVVALVDRRGAENYVALSIKGKE